MTAPSEEAAEFVTLRGRLVTSLEALRLGWALEARGFVMEPDGDRLRVTPRGALTPDDVAAITQHRDALLALVRYHAPEA